MRPSLMIAGMLIWTVLPVQADTFFLKDGTRLEGTAEVQDATTVITTYEGKVVKVPTADVIGSKKEPDRNEYVSKSKALKPDDAAGHFELGQWAKKKGLEDWATEQFRKTLDAEPGHDGAGQALGYVKKDGIWVTPHASTLVIGPSKGTPPNESKVREDDARALAKKLKALKLPEGKPPEAGPELAPFIEQAKVDPEPFIRVLMMPGKPNSANEQDGNTRARAAFVLGQAQDRRALQPLLSTLFEDPDERARVMAIQALPKLQDPIAIRKLTDAAIDGRFAWPVRKQACWAIKKYGDVEAVERLMAETSFELAGGNAKDAKNPLRSGPRGLGSEDPLNMMPDNLPIGQQDDTLIYPALSALKEVTGQNFDKKEKDYKVWREWWEKARATFKFPE